MLLCAAAEARTRDEELCLLGKRVTVYWKGEAKSYPGVVAGVRTVCMFDVAYDDGDRQWEYSVREEEEEEEERAFPASLATPAQRTRRHPVQTKRLGHRDGWGIGKSRKWSSSAGTD